MTEAPRVLSIRIAIVVIRRSDGRWYAHRRRLDKRVFPGLWGLGAGGRVEPGETTAEGARRELYEEAGLEMEPEHVATFPFDSSGVIYQVSLYQVHTDQPVQHDVSEWLTSDWRTTEQVERLREQGLLCPDTAACFDRVREADGSARPSARA